MVFSRGIREAAALPYAVAIREIDDLALDLVKGQQLVSSKVPPETLRSMFYLSNEIYPPENPAFLRIPECVF